MEYCEALDWLFSLQKQGVHLGLEPMERLLRALRWTPQGPKWIHVAGTNGKGSLCAIMEAMCLQAGLRVGLYTSPHLVDFSERMRVNGVSISKEEILNGLTHLRELTRDWAPAPTFFEFTTALALDWFVKQNLDVVILETGLGGRLDATNVVIPNVCVFANVDFDHTKQLGNTLTAIAQEKAGIMKPSVPAISATQSAEVKTVFAQTATRLKIPLQILDADQTVPQDWKVQLAGSHQRHHAAVAIAALEAAEIFLPDADKKNGLQKIQWPGRFQLLEEGNIILDGAHNPSAAARLTQTWVEEMGPNARATVILGMLKDKDYFPVCKALTAFAAEIIAVPVQTNPRSCSTQEILDAFQKIGFTGRVQPAQSLEEALEIAKKCKKNRILITGSFFLVGEALHLLLTNKPGRNGSLPRPSYQ